jgi:transglutaminase-like putative cysteine protease
MVLMLSVHPSRQGDLSEHRIELSDGLASRDYIDTLGNVCTRPVAPSGLLEVRNEFLIRDRPCRYSCARGPATRNRRPPDALRFLMGSRYCDTEKLSDLARSLFGGVEGGWQRVQAICDYVHGHIEFGYHHARCDRTASEGHTEQRVSAAILRILR